MRSQVRRSSILKIAATLAATCAICAAGVAQAAVIVTIAGSTLGDGGPGTGADLGPSGVTLDVAGNIYVAGTPALVRRIDAATGLITTYAGTGFRMFGGDGGQALMASMNGPHGLHFDAPRNVLYIADVPNQRIRKVDAATGIITTVAGNGVAAFAGDGGAATSASLNQPASVAVDASGNLFIADAGNLRVRRVDALTGIITTVAGGGSPVGNGDGGPATNAVVDPWSIAFDSSGNLFIAEQESGRVRKVATDSGIISTIAGGGTETGDGGAATNANLARTSGIAFDSGGNLLIADDLDCRVRKVNLGTGIITTLAGNGALVGPAGEGNGDGGLATNARLTYPSAVARDGSGNIFIVEHNRVRKVSASSGVITLVAGTYSVPTRSIGGFEGDGGPARRSLVSGPVAVSVDAGRNVYFADAGNHRIRKVVAASGNVTTIGGNGTSTFSGDGGPGTLAGLVDPSGVAAVATGSIVYIADRGAHRIRKLNAASGVITTVAGTGAPGYGGDGGLAIQAMLNDPTSVAVNGSGAAYIADTGNHRIRLYAPATQVLTTFAGNGSAGYAGDGGAAMSASLNAPRGAAVDRLGNVFIADTGNHRVRRVDSVTGVITTVAGNGVAGFSGDGDSATSASLNGPMAVAVDADGNLLIADTGNRRIRKVTLANATISTVAGTEVAPANLNGSNVGDWGSPTRNATLAAPMGVAADATEGFVIADRDDHRLREVFGSAESATRRHVNDGSSPSYSSTGQTSTSSALVLYTPDAGLGFPFPQVSGSTSAPIALTLKNLSSSTAIDISSIVASSEFSVSQGCGLLQPGDTCPINLSFSPAGAGEQPGTLTVNSDYAAAPALTWLVAGFGIAPPGAPALGQAVAGSGAVTLDFTPPSYDGESTITSFTGTCGGVSASATGSPIIVSGLVNGSPYTCTVRAMNGAGPGPASNAIQATPVAPTFELQVQRIGSGTGTVASSAGGIDCGSSCSAAIAQGTSVTLTATPAAGSAFAGWSGSGCSGTGTCMVTVNSATTVTATFNIAASSVRGDFNADGKSDIVLRNTSDGSLLQWLMNGTSLVQQASLGGPGTTDQPKHIADFNGDGKADILWQDTNGDVSMTLMDGANVLSDTILVAGGGGWTASHVGDFNGDGKSDIIWTNTDGSVQSWLMNGTTVLQVASFVPPGSGWNVHKIADINGDGKSDIFWIHTSGAIQAWLMDGLTVTGLASFVAAGSGWTVALAADVDGDGKQDLVWQHTDGSAQVWLMNGTSVAQLASMVPAGTGYTATHAGDLNGDGKQDLMWRGSDGTVIAWIMGPGLTVSQVASFTGSGNTYSITHTRDLDGDGKADLLWKAPDGTILAWLMNGLTAASIAQLVPAGPYLVVPPMP